MSKSIFKNLWFYVAILVVISIIYFAIPRVEDGEYDTFATCTNEKGLVMYGTDWCPHCQNQKALFGSSFENVNFVNCDFNEAECNTNGVTGYPTWKLGIQKFSGVQSLEKLAALTGCELVKDSVWI